ncbi:hypothetical protein MMC26_004917 [Xylographa opegraphella]|nr:hypothetical protein [Xylographa opegraphella]
MEGSPSKRRRLSPITSTIAPATGDASDYQSQPTHDYEALPRTPRQASFLSPTKASLAQHSPSLLPRPKSAGDVVQAENVSKAVYRQHGEKPRRYSSGLNPVALRSITPLTSPTELAGHQWAPTVSLQRKSIPLARGTSVAPKPRPRTPRRVSSSSPISHAPAILASPPRPVQELEAELEDTVGQQHESEVHPNTTRPLPNNPAPRPLDHIGIEKDYEEPELPLTPTQLGLEVPPEPPKGLLYSSPSRRSSRRNGSSIKSSPLKPTDTPLRVCPRSLLGKKRAATDDPTNVRPKAVDAPDDAETVAKKQIRDELLLQYQELNDDVAEMERAARQADVGGLVQPDKLISIITSSNSSRQRALIHEKNVSISSRVAQFMPFSKPLVSRKQPDPTSSLPIPSHNPLQLEDPLPHLQVFTSLTIDSVSSIVPSSESSQPWLQHHDITFTSTENLLRIGLHLSVNPADQSVNSLTVDSVSSWAKSELGDWLNDQASSGDLPIIGWACGKYWEVALLRARCWKRCYQRFRGLICATLESNSDEIYVGNDTAGPTRKPSQGDGDEAYLDGSEDREDLQPNLGMSDSDVRSRLGQQSILFSAFSVSFLVTWRINFNWTGEVESFVSACTSFPKAWQNADERASLGNISKVFDRLVQDRGVFEAARIIVGLLYEQN